MYLIVLPGVIPQTEIYTELLSVFRCFAEERSSCTSCVKRWALETASLSGFPTEIAGHFWSSDHVSQLNIHGSTMCLTTTVSCRVCNFIRLTCQKSWQFRWVRTTKYSVYIYNHIYIYMLKTKVGGEVIARVAFLICLRILYYLCIYNICINITSDFDKDDLGGIHWQRKQLRGGG